MIAAIAIANWCLSPPPQTRWKIVRRGSRLTAAQNPPSNIVRFKISLSGAAANTARMSDLFLHVMDGEDIEFYGGHNAL